MLRVGLLVNPIAGLGGEVALKGSDGAAVQEEARRRGGHPRAGERAREFLRHCDELVADGEIEWLTRGGEMGETHLASRPHTTVGSPAAGEADAPTSVIDTHEAVRDLYRAGIDLLVFVGGDGTARDVLAALTNEAGDATHTVVLGIPAGVKMHSGVFAVTPRTGAMLLADLVCGRLLAKVNREVRDYDEASDDLSIKRYGELSVPEAGGYLQHTKIGGKESEPLVLEEISADIVERDLDQALVVVGPGSTCRAIKERLGITTTLRGFDVRVPSGDTHADVDARTLVELLRSARGSDKRVHLIVSFTRAQGFLFGRGNQQLTSEFLGELVWPGEVIIVGSRTKLDSLDGRPLLVDTGDQALDDAFEGIVEILCGYDDRLLHRLTANPSAAEPAA